MTTQFDILGIGNILMDIIAPVSDDFLKKEKIEKASMALIGEERATKLTNLFLSQSKIAGSCRRLSCKYNIWN